MRGLVVKGLPWAGIFTTRQDQWVELAQRLDPLAHGVAAMASETPHLPGGLPDVPDHTVHGSPWTSPSLPLDGPQVRPADTVPELGTLPEQVVPEHKLRHIFRPVLELPTDGHPHGVAATSVPDKGFALLLDGGTALLWKSGKEEGVVLHGGYVVCPPQKEPPLIGGEEDRARRREKVKEGCIHQHGSLAIELLALVLVHVLRGVLAHVVDLFGVLHHLQAVICPQQHAAVAHVRQQPKKERAEREDQGRNLEAEVQSKPEAADGAASGIWPQEVGGQGVPVVALPAMLPQLQAVGVDHCSRPHVVVDNRPAMQGPIPRDKHDDRHGDHCAEEHYHLPLSEDARLLTWSVDEGPL
mmetsp:Transcript_62883/g.167937  ORF Transcript_62883/g.167937 Transcript_62883/m.167937 type:complete len:355 (-) Transcript_62883:40-1104(-)